MIRTQIQLTGEQAKRLRDVAAAEGRSMADVIRESVDAYLAEAPLRRSADALRTEALALAGKYQSGLGDLAADHDRYLAEDLAR
jgi:predicted DNA-binding protein